MIVWEDEKTGKNKRGRKQAIGLTFDYAGKQRVIPALYRFPDGVIFDILTVIDEAEFRDFHTKYESAEETMTMAQRLAAESDHPYQSVAIRKLVIDGAVIESRSAITLYHAPWLGEGYSYKCEIDRKSVM